MEKLKTIDGETLMGQPLQPQNFVVDTLLSQGLHILAGSPKVGKSWLALWLAVTVAKGEQVWGMDTRQGTTLYLCLEDSTLRIQNRLFQITEDAPANVHFCTESSLLGRGLEEQIETFLSEHPDTVLVILLIHHLRKEKADDVFARISGTTAISGAVDTSLTLVEKNRGSGKAKLSCIGRDIEYRELMLERNEDNVWLVTADSREQPELLGDRIIFLLSGFLKERLGFIGTPTELAEAIDPNGREQISARRVSRRILQSVDELRKLGIEVTIRRSNGKRLIELTRADSADTADPGTVDPIDPVAAANGHSCPGKDEVEE